MQQDLTADTHAQEREKDLDKKVRWQTKHIKRRHIPCFHDLALQYALILWCL